MGLKEAWENLCEWFIEKKEQIKRNHLIKNITPKALRDMIAGLKEEADRILEIENEFERETELANLKNTYGEVESIVNDVLVHVLKQIDDLSGRNGFWATQDAVNSDLRGLQKGKDTLIAMKNDLSKFKTDVFGPSEAESDQGEEQEEIRFE